MKNTVLLHGKLPGCIPFPALTYLYFEKPLTMSFFTTLLPPSQKRFSAFLLLFWLLAGMSYAQTIRYVKPTATGTGDGSSWDNASSDLQGMINASGTSEVWVAKGTYKPGTGRNASFSMKAGVKIYGSFAGTETNLSERTSTVMTANQSILSGDLNGDDVITGSGATLSITNNGENCYHVVYNVYDGGNRLTTDNSLLDGFTITGGNANGESTSSAARGGGMYNASSSPNLTNIIFSGNNAGVDGGGLHNNNSFPSLSNGTFEKNQANKGGGINGTTSSPVLNNVLFKGNKASAGGGMYNFTTFTPTLTNVIFKENKADGNGGGICNDNGNVNLNNVYFIDNQASYGGGMYDYYAYGDRNNVVFSGNIASENGGGIYSSKLSYATYNHVIFTDNQATNGGGIFNNNDNASSTLYKNGVFWGNTATGTGPDIRNNIGNIRLDYCSLQLESSNYSSGFTLGGGMRYAQNPLFVNAADPDGADNVLGTSDDGLQLSPCAPVINAGTNAGAASTDIIGNPRSFGGTVDMGAYEYQGPPVIGTRLYVNAAAAANGDGSSWATAYTDLQTALANARLCSQITEIWVAKGTYKPTAGSNRSASFSLVAGVKIYGSFAGIETNLSERTLAVMAANKSILSGDLNGDDATTGKGENSYHVILNDNNGLTTSNSLLDGFTITGGNASEDSGGGMYNKSSSPSLSNLSFVGNESYSSGGGVNNFRSSPSLVNCSFLGNKASVGGGGMGNEGDSSPSLVNCSFLGNEAVKGGGIYNMFFCAPSLVNCSLSGNKALSSGGGISSIVYSPVSLKNCILWGNKSEDDYNEVESDDSDSNPTYTNTLVEGLAVGGFQGTENPLFVNQPSVGLGTSGDLRLQACSPVLNVGNNANNSTTVDLGGNNRKVGTIDLGAYEYQSAPPAVVTPTVSVNHPITCGGAEGSISLSGFLNSTTYSVTYKKNTNAVAAANFTSNGSGVITLTDLGAGNYTDIVATYGSCVSNAATATLTDPAKPTATIAGTTAVCKNGVAPSLTFTGQNGTSPYTFTYKMNGGVSQTVTTASGNSVTVSVPTGAAGVFSYSLESVSNPNNCSQTQMGNATVTVNPLPTATISGTTAVCQNSPAPNVTFTGANATAPYIFTYKMNGGSPQTITTTSGNSVTVAAPTGTAGVFTYTLVSVSESSSTTCSQTQTGSAAVTVNPLPTASIAGTTTVCQNSPAPNVTFTGANATAPYIFTYKMNGGSPQTITTTSGNSVTVAAPTGTAGGFVYTLVSVSESSSTACSQTQMGNATVTVNPLPTATISGTATVCQNSPSPNVTFTGANATAPYTFTYKINGGSPQTVTTSSGNSVTVAAPTGTAGVFAYTLVGVSESSSTACSQTQTGNATVTIQGKPTISLTTQQVTLNEGNNQTFCDTDANSVNSLQFMVLNSCVAGNPVWRVQTGSSTWSEWRSTIPGSQPSNNQPYRYQAACDANCASTYSGVIEVKINYRASTPQNVSLAADGVSVKEGEAKEVCNQEGNALTFNATCGAGELLLYSVDGGDYSTVVPTQWVDGQYHNYRVRCRKADGTASCVETESGVMRLRITSLSQVPVATLNVTSGCGTPVAFSGTTTCGSLTTIWYNATTNAILATLPVQTPNETASYYARCQAEGGCLSEKSNVVTYTVIPVSTAPTVTASAEVVCTGTEVTISTSCPTGTTPFWNTGVTESSFKVAFSNVTRQSYWVRCTYSNGCQSAESVRKEILWKAFELTFINIGQSQSAVKTNDRAAWASQFITPDGGPSLEFSTQANPTLFFSEKVNKTAPRFWTIHADVCALGTNGSLTFDLLANPEAGVPRSFNTHENNAPYFMYANREGYTELYAQNHPAYGFYQANGSGGNTYDAGLPKGLYKLGIRYWDQKGQGSIYPSTRQPQGNVLTYQEYWFRIQSQNGVGTGSARNGSEQTLPDSDNWIRIGQNPVVKEIEIHLSGTAGEETMLSLVNLQGQTLQQKSLKLLASQHLEVLNIEKSAAGMYILKAVKGNKSQTFKIIKTE